MRTFKSGYPIGKISIERLKKRVEAARGDRPSDIVLKGGRVVNVFSGEILESDVAVHDDAIVGLGQYEGSQEIDVRGRYVCPGFMDGHFHIESSMLSPRKLARAVVPRGTTTIVADPHEIANVMGKAGIRYMLESSHGLPVDFYFMLPSCVPATDLETSGAKLTAEDLLAFKAHPRVLGLGEMMNFPGLIHGVHSVLEKVVAFQDRNCDGHAPLVSGKALNAYVAAGIRSDHECTLLEEAKEKLRLGMAIMIREGTQAKNLDTLLPLVSPGRIRHCMLVSDDLHPHDLLEKGHVNHLVDRAVEQGLDPVMAIQMVTLNPTRHFGLTDRGVVAPGYRADLAVASSLRPIEVDMVLKDGRIVFDKREQTDEAPAQTVDIHLGAMRIKPYQTDSFLVRKTGSRMRVIGLVRGQIVTKHETAEAPVRAGFVVSDPEQDLLKITVVERHKATGHIGLGFVRGFGLKRGALASSVAHDSHNIICVGCHDADIYAAVRDVEAMGGGLSAVKAGEVLAHLALPIGGLMSDRPLYETARGWGKMRSVANALGCRMKEPFMALSFLALPVIPELKITDRGLVDVNRFEPVPLFIS